jgi:hypothetical protein
MFEFGASHKDDWTQSGSPWLAGINDEKGVSQYRS